jgi:hypothetical protein
MRISVFGTLLRILRAASRPLRSGMLISMTRTSGFSCSARDTASRPVFASATTSQPCLEANNSFRPRRIMSWSSATTIRKFCSPLEAFCLGIPVRTFNKVQHPLHGDKDCRTEHDCLHPHENTYGLTCIHWGFRAFRAWTIALEDAVFSGGDYTVAPIAGRA